MRLIPGLRVTMAASFASDSPYRQGLKPGLSGVNVAVTPSSAGDHGCGIDYQHERRDRAQGETVHEEDIIHGFTAAGKRPGAAAMHVRRFRVALLTLVLSVGLVACSSGSVISNAATAPATTQSTSASETPTLSTCSSQSQAPNRGNQDALNKAWACGLSAGLDKLKGLGPDGKNLYDAIYVTLAGRNLAANRADLFKAATEFSLDLAPLGKCFEPYFLPPQQGAERRQQRQPALPSVQTRITGPYWC
jgi:hypothetical protein